MTDMPKLTDCQFCSSDNITIHFVTGTDGSYHQATCESCKMRGPTGGSVDAAVKWWIEMCADLSPAPVAPKVKALEWEYHPAGKIASDNLGLSYIIDTRRKQVSFLKWPQGYAPEVLGLEAAKAAAQADYERRILSALEPASPWCTDMEKAPRDGTRVLAVTEWGVETVKYASEDIAGDIMGDAQGWQSGWWGVEQDSTCKPEFHSPLRSIIPAKHQPIAWMPIPTMTEKGA